MTEVNPDVLACMHAIHKAANDGTFDKDTINTELKKMHDFLTGAGYEEVNDTASEEEATAEEASATRKPRKKR